MRYKTVPAQRGNILDIYGIPLATNHPITNVLWKGTGHKTLRDNQLATINRINQILSNYTIDIQAIKRAERFKLETMIASNITAEQLYALAEQCSDIDNIIFQTATQRFYPHQNLASHLLGYLHTNTTIQGQMGLEKLCQETLEGDAGILLQYTNSVGSLLNCQEIQKAKQGSDIITTLDLSIQMIIEKALEEEISGCCIILDPKNGSIKGLVSKPNFNPDIFSKSLTTEEWQEYQKDKTFLNRAFNAAYPPASIFKLVTLAAALNENIITPKSHFFCPGYMMFKDRQYYCNRRTGHGTVDTPTALAQSCNIPFFEIAKSLPIDTLAKYAFDFGFGMKTNIPFAEKEGIVPTNEWKKKHKKERWWMGETLSACIGQSFLLVTPIQVACMIGSIFQGYLVQPRILEEQEIVKRPLSLSNNTRLFLQDCMRLVSESGTARRVHKVKELTIFAKTGTAQTRTRKMDEDPDKPYQNREDKPHAWFVSYFYMDNAEPLVMVMLLEHVGRANYTLPIVMKIFSNYRQLIHQRNS